MKKFLSFFASFILLFNSLVSPFAVSYAQEAVLVSEPTPVAEETATPAPTADPVVEEVSAPVEAFEEVATPTPAEVDEVVSVPATFDLPQESHGSSGGSSSYSSQSDSPVSSATAVPTAAPQLLQEEGHLAAIILEDTSAASITSDELTVNTDGSATLQTDKADYAPTDSVLVTGTGFKAGKVYKIIISSADNPAITYEDSVTADTQGNIIYIYQLDGNYRPNYKVEVKDGQGLVASTTFTDSRVTVSATLNGGATATVAPQGTLRISVTATLSGGDDWHSVGWRIANSTGSFTCADIPDHDSNGTYTESFTINAPSTPDPSYNVYIRISGSNSNCNNSVGSTITLADSLTVISGPSWPASWTTPNSCAADPAPEASVGVDDLDLIGDALDPAVGFATDSNYRYFRERVNGDPGTFNPRAWVVIFQTSAPQYQYLVSLEGNGDKVQLWQNTSPSGPINFNPLLNDPAEAKLWEGNASIYARRVSAGGGIYFVDWAIPKSELAGTGIDDDTTKYFATSANGNNFNKDHLNCYENPVTTGSITITKDVIPDDASTWTFTVSNGLVSYTHDLSDGQSYKFDNLTPGSFNISEISSPDYVTYVTCGGNGPYKQNGFLGTVTAGQDLLCKFENYKIPTLTVTKLLDPASDSGKFNLLIDGNGVGVNVGHNYTTTPLRVDIGRHQVTETAGTGTNLADYTAVFGGACDSQGYVTLQAGDNKNCTITNTKKKITVNVVKLLDADGNPSTTSDQTAGGGWNFDVKVWSAGAPQTILGSVTTDEAGRGTLSFVPGTSQYKVEETVKTGYQPVTAYCRIGAAPVGSYGSGSVFGISASAGDTIDCTFVNYKEVGHLTVVKSLNPTTDSGRFNLRINGVEVKHNAGNGGTSGRLEYVPGNYVVSEVAHSGTDISNYVSRYECLDLARSNENVASGEGTSQVISLHEGDNIVCTFTNTRKGSISGYKWNDENGNGVRDGHWNSNRTRWYWDEATISDLRIFVDANNNSLYDSGEVYDRTDGSGNYDFLNLRPGTYRICESINVADGWKNTYPGNVCQSVAVGAGEVKTNVNFGNQRLGSIRVCKVIIDSQGNIVNGSVLAGSTFTINWNKLAPSVFTAGFIPNARIFSSSEGNDAFCIDYPDIRIDSYTYSPEIISGLGWKTPKYNDQFNTRVLDLGDFYFFGRNNDSNGIIDLAQVGPSRTLVILNQYQLSTVKVYKFNDLNTNGIREENESLMPDWDMVMAEQGGLSYTQKTDEGGATTFAVASGSWVLSESFRDGWLQSGISCPVEAGIEAGVYNGNTNSYSFSVLPGQTLNCYVGNYEKLPKIEIKKTNDKSGGIGQNDTVTYTLSLKNTGNMPLYEIAVKDAPAGGFTYIAGSSTLNGDLLDDPVVSGGYLIWQIGGLKVGEEAVLTYKLLTAADLMVGTYTNYATCQALFGENRLPDFEVVALVSEAIKDSLNQVTCDPDSSTVTRGVSYGYGGNLSPQVLGAATELPATGSRNWLLLLAGVSGIFGVGLKVFEKKDRRYGKN